MIRMEFLSNLILDTNRLRIPHHIQPSVGTCIFPIKYQFGRLLPMATTCQDNFDSAYLLIIKLITNRGGVCLYFFT